MKTEKEFEQGQPDAEKLPDDYDRLIPVDQLVHGEHNPRRVRPRDELRRSIDQIGIDCPVIVHPDEDNNEVYHITDGWQRYQAATSLGYEMLPANVYETALDALDATETESIVREWTTYGWARYCRSVASELEAESRHKLSAMVAERTVKSQWTVRRYLEVLDLPDEIHPLLTDGPTGTESEWTALQNWNTDIRRYDGLSWKVAYELARRKSEISKDRTIGIAANAVTFNNRDSAIEFVDCAVEESEKTLDIVRREVLLGQKHDQYLEVPRTAVKLDEKQKQAVMDYCHENRQSLGEIVTETVESLATEAVEQ